MEDNKHHHVAYTQCVGIVPCIMTGANALRTNGLVISVARRVILPTVAGSRNGSCKYKLMSTQEPMRLLAKRAILQVRIFLLSNRMMGMMGTIRNAEYSCDNLWYWGKPRQRHVDSQNVHTGWQCHFSYWHSSWMYGHVKVVTRQVKKQTQNCSHQISESLDMVAAVYTQWVRLNCQCGTKEKRTYLFLKSQTKRSYFSSFTFLFLFFWQWVQ